MSENTSPNTAPTSARIISLVRSIPLAVDLGRYELAEAAFAPRVRIDYSSLWGGEAQEMATVDLMAAWRSLVPGFDATLHELGPVQVSLNGDSAQATADVVASHWLDGQLWRLIGRYEWPLRQGPEGWRVTGMSFQRLQEHGDRGLCERAQARVAARA